VVSYNEDMVHIVSRRPEDLGTAIAEFRAESGLTQAELARQVGLHRTYLSNIERGETPEFVRRYFALLDALGLELTISRTHS
jgi:transcriptional regulator with XRE-family HTH domain